MYDFIILDFGNVTGHEVCLLRQCSGIYVPVEDAELLEDAMKTAADAASSRNLLDYRTPVKYDVFCMLFRLTAIVLLGLMLGVVKMYLCEPFLETRLLWKTSVICSLAAAACVELGMNRFGLLPSWMRFFMCVLLAEGTLGKGGSGGSDSYDLYRNFD